jgi:hypothetical protein
MAHARRSQALTAGRSRSVLERVALLVTHATLHRHRPEHLGHRGPERLAAVEDDEHPLLDIQATVDEV